MWRERSWRYAVASCLGLCLAVLTLARLPLGPQRVELGAPADSSFVQGAWSRGWRLDIDPQASADDTLAFYFRSARTGAGLALPLEARGRVTLRLRAQARVRSLATVLVAGRPAGQVLVSTRRWEPLPVDLGQSGVAWRPLDLDLALRPLARTRGAHGGAPEIMVDWVELAAPDGLRLTLTAGFTLALVPAALVIWALTLRLRPGPATAVTLAGSVALMILVRAAPLAAVAAVPRLLPLALVAGALVFAVLRRAPASPGDRRALAALVTVGTLAHGALVFLPNHNPPDLETHAGRAHDLRLVPFEYQALLRYGSHLPTATQTAAPATDLFGGQALVPYSPLPYFIYYAAAWLGFELRWLMTALGAALAMGTAAALWLAAQATWGRAAAWLAALLYALDLPVWHHVGRAHVTASLGQALGTAALAFLVARADRVDTRARILGAGALLSAGVLGYTSLVVLFGLFGLSLLALLVLDARALAPRARMGLALALAVGGALSLALYYGHYLPGLLGSGGGGAVEAAPDLFTGRTVLGIFRNEGRQSYRIWTLGFAYALSAGLVAAPLALRRARAAARPVLGAWLAAWALLVVLKDPLLFPNTLRWAKEDQFVSPVLALFVAAAVTALPRGWMRWSAGALALAGSSWIQSRDFLLHANTLPW